MSSHYPQSQQYHQYQSHISSGSPPVPSTMIMHEQRAFVVNPSSNELALGWLEQWRRSKLSKAWKRVLVSLVKGPHSMEGTSICVWREVISETTGTSAMELLQQIPMREVQWVDYDTNIHSQAGGENQQNRFAVSLFQASEDVIFRSLQDPQAISNWVTTLKTVQKHIQQQKHETPTFAFAHAPSADNLQTQSHLQTQTEPTHQPTAQPQVDLLSFDQPATTTHTNTNTTAVPQNQAQPIPVHYQNSNNGTFQPFQQPQPNLFQQHQQPPSFAQPYPTQHRGRSISPTPPNMMMMHKQPPPRAISPVRAHSPPPLSYHNNPYAPQPQMFKKQTATPAPAPPPPVRPTPVPGVPQKPTTTQHQHHHHNLHQPQWNHQAGFATNPMMRNQQHGRFQSIAHNNAAASGIHHNPLHARSHTPPPRAKPPAPIPRPHNNAAARTTQSQPNMPHVHQQHHRPVPPPTRSPPARTKSAPMPQTHNHNNDDAARQRQEDIKRRVIQDWALQPPAYQQLKPLAELIRTIPKVFPPHATYVTHHAYFEKWDVNTMFDLSAGAGTAGACQKTVRKLRFFLHPDKLPKDLTSDQVFLCKLLWDVVNDAQQQQEQAGGGGGGP